MNKFINVLLYLMFVVLTFQGIFTDNNLIILVAVWGLLYTSSFTTAESDREVGLSHITLSSWTKRLLFPFQPNPFRGKTIIFQTVWTVSNVVVIIVGLLFPNSARILLFVNLFIMLIFVGHWCDMTFKKKSQIKNGLRPDPKKSTEEGDNSNKWWDNNRCK